MGSEPEEVILFGFLHVVFDIYVSLEECMRN